MLTATADTPAASEEPLVVEVSTVDQSLGWRASMLPRSSYDAFRICFGLLIAFSQFRFVVRGWVAEFYLAPEYHLTTPGFGWVAPLPGVLMYAVVIGLGVLGLFIAADVRPRIAAGLFVMGFGYCELIDAALYLNHYWFMTLAALLVALLPGPRGAHVPAITIWALRAQLGAVYVFAGIAKVNADWLLRGEPLATWLAARTDRLFIGALLDEPGVALALSWAGALFDLTIVGWLLWRRSRVAAYAVLVVFHLATATLFQIGVFPWVMIALTPIFFDPSWPKRVAVRRGAAPAPLLSAAVLPVRRPTLVALAALLAINLWLPLRHLAADGNVRWNDDGYLLSWRVMLTERATDVVFTVRDPATGVVSVVDVGTVLDEWQASAALVRADLIVSTAHLIADEHRMLLGRDVEVYADAVAAWNGRVRAPWIDPTVDLAALSRSAPASHYVLAEPVGV